MTAFPVSSQQEVVHRLRSSIQSGRHWYLALLEAVRDYPEDNFLVAGDALDWISLTRELLEAVSDIVPPQELDHFLKKGKPPIKLSAQEARQLIGTGKYNRYLNFLYGVTVEAALIQAVSSEVVKEVYSIGLRRPKNAADEAFLRIYGEERRRLRSAFEGQDASSRGRDGDGNEAEFIYWLFKYRLAHQDKEKIASDTKKALDWLKTRAGYFPRLF